MQRLCGLLLSLVLSSSASAVSMEWTAISNPGNACDPLPSTLDGPGCFGAVGYAYNVGTYEVTHAQYAEFLNAKAATDPLGLYNTSMGSGGITRTGSSGSFTYTVKPTFADKPVYYVSFYDAVRFANWLSNGQGSGDTETGSYTLLGGTATPSNDSTVMRAAGATIVLPNENEWYKAAYYAASTASYFDYPAGSDTQTTCAGATATPNSASCNFVAGIVAKGSYTGSASPSGTYDQGGNAFEWNETLGLRSGYIDCRPDRTKCRGLQGGSFATPALYLGGLALDYRLATSESMGTGFRVAMIPEPGTGLLVVAGMLGLAGWRPVRR